MRHGLQFVDIEIDRRVRTIKMHAAGVAVTAKRKKPV